MKGMSEFIVQHNKTLQNTEFGPEFLAYHLTQIQFIQHERLAHLIVMLFVMLSALICLALFLFHSMLAFLLLFTILLVLSVFYIFHYFKLENTVIGWYYIYNDRAKINRLKPPP